MVRWYVAFAPSVSPCSFCSMPMLKVAYAAASEWRESAARRYASIAAS